MAAFNESTYKICSMTYTEVIKQSLRYIYARLIICLIKICFIITVERFEQIKQC